MDFKESKDVVISAISGVLKGDEKISEETFLIGDGGLLDSMKLVEVCLMLEDLADEHGFEFDWTSAATMSKSRSIFRTVRTLAEEFTTQSEA